MNIELQKTLNNMFFLHQVYLIHQLQMGQNHKEYIPFGLYISDQKNFGF